MESILSRCWRSWEFPAKFWNGEVDTLDIVTLRRKRSASPCPVSPEILSEIKNVKEQVAKIFKILSKRQIPMGLLNAVEESFSCTICKVCPPKLPFICYRSCSSIVGCESCANLWYGSGQVALTKHAQSVGKREALQTPLNWKV